MPTLRQYLGVYAVCLDASERLLLCRLRAERPDAGRWTLPGGGLDWGEAPEQGVLREVTEETGLVTDVAPTFLSVYSGVYPESGVHHLGLLYRLQGLRGHLRDEPDGSTDRAAYFTRAELDHLPLVPLVRAALPLVWEGGLD
jgi:8-oxo-dGTP diphosphatase